MVIIILLILGLMVGSFLNVFIYRWPQGEQWVRGRSRCLKCKHDLAWYDLFPLFSFILLGGKCRYCGVKLSWQYPLVEIANAAGWLAIWWLATHGQNFIGLTGVDPSTLILTVIAGCIVWSCLIVILVIDLKHYLIPDEPLILIGLIGLGMSFWASPTLMERVLAGGLAFASFGLLHWGTDGRGLGWADVKLIGVLGLLLGWEVGLVMAVSFILGSVVGIVLLLGGKVQLGRAIPFGPFLVAGTIMVILWANQIHSGYLGLFGFGG